MRTGLIARKIGMSRVFQNDGQNIPVTLLKVDNCKVIDHRNIDKHGYTAIKITYGQSKKTTINRPTKGYFKKVQTEATNLTAEFRVSQDGIIEIGKDLSVNHFLDGQFVDISGFTIGKGFAGGMKRHNFSGNRASHGVSISHRSHGSTGQCQDPGKVFKGKKMAGRLGNVKRTIQCLKVITTDHRNGLIVIKGSVPGPKGLFVEIRDSLKRKTEKLPYPTVTVNTSSKIDALDSNQPSNVNEANNTDSNLNKVTQASQPVAKEKSAQNDDKGKDLDFENKKVDELNILKVEEKKDDIAKDDLK
tara:strand:+ start:1190 stop:2098 length:909 start_codon:yes stop_codon:yes gene_type:complete